MVHHIYCGASLSVLNRLLRVVGVWPLGPHRPKVLGTQPTTLDLYSLVTDTMEEAPERPKRLVEG
jgi:hypothetical protein